MRYHIRGMEIRCNWFRCNRFAKREILNETTKGENVRSDDITDLWFQAEPLEDLEGIVIGGRFVPIPDLYESYLASKKSSHECSGIDVEVGTLHCRLFDFQRDIVRWALRKGKAAVFADCGLGKTLIQLEWARHVPGRVLILAPLAVAQQTERESGKLDLQCPYLRAPSADTKITVTNYQMLEYFNPKDYIGIVLDESSILKSFEGHFRNRIIESFRNTPYRLACTATPAPNDYMELANHAEFLGTMTRAEMLSMFFVHDGGQTSQWRLKRHAVKEFFRWVCSWAVNVRRPSDLGYNEEQFILPKLEIHEHQAAVSTATKNMLFPMPAVTMDERRHARSVSVPERSQEVRRIIDSRSKEQWIVWCNLNKEADAVTRLVPGAVEVRGSQKLEEKEQAIRDFLDGKIRVLVTKPSIFGFGLNLQCCHNIIFMGLSDSWETYYQAIRRCWRFQQTSDVHCHIVTSVQEGEVVKNIRRKEADSEIMAQQMTANMRDINSAELRPGTRNTVEPYEWRVESSDCYTMYLGDCVDVLKGLASDSIHYSIFSPPFASLYTYSASERDMGNCRSHGEFYLHFEFAIRELYRVMMSGRLLSFHCMNLPTSKERDGVIGITDFRGKLISMFQDAGFIYHSEVVIWKDPVTAMQRTKALGLLHKQLKKDSCMSRQGIPDYLVTMRKPGDNPERVSHTNDSFPVSLWQRYASPVWMDINPSETLQRESAREEADEKHICPLQLEVIRRALELWTNASDTVLSPFAGIGSEGYEAVKMGRKFIGIELKESYYLQAVGNLKCATQLEADLFSKI